MAGAVRFGTNGGEGGQSLILNYEGDAPSPEQQAMHHELVALVREFIDTIREELINKGRDLAIIEAYLEDMERPQREIAEIVGGVHQWKVSRTLAWFHDRLRRLFEQSSAM